MLKYVKAVALAAAAVIALLLLQLVVTAVFAAVGGMGASNIEAGMEQYILDNTHLITAVWNIAVIALTALLFERKKPRREALRLTPLHGRTLLPILVLGAAAASMISASLALIPLPEEVIEDYAMQQSLGAGESAAIQLLHTMLLAPVSEELAFRLAVYGILRRAFSAPVSAALSSFAFGMMHISALWAAYAALAGLMLCAVYELTGSIFAPILCHIAFNLFGVLIMPQAVINGFVAAALLAVSAAAAVYCFKCIRQNKFKDPEEV